MSEYHKKRRGITEAFWVRTLVLLAAFGVRCVSLDAQGLWRDEVDQWRFALQPWSDLLNNFTRPGWNGPLYSPMLRIWMSLVGESVFAMRFLSLLWGVLSVALIFRLGRRLVGRRAALWAMLLSAFSPYFVWYAQEIKMYTWVPFLVLVILYVLDRALRSPRWYWILILLVSMILLVYSHILGLLLIPVLLSWFVLHYWRSRRFWIVMLVVLLILMGLALPMLRWIVPMLLTVRETGYPDHTLWQMIVTLLNGWSVGINLAGIFWKLIAGLAMGAFGALILLGMIWLLYTRRYRALIKLLLWLWVPLLLLWLVSLRGPIFTDRYLIWTAPAFYLLTAVGLAALHKFNRDVLFALLVLLGLLNGLGLYRQAVYPIKPRFDRVVRYLQAHREPDDLLVFQIPYNQRVVAYYYGQQEMPPWVEAPYTNWTLADGTYRVDEAYVAEQMQSLLADHSRVWLVYSEVLQWDARELVKQWLDRTGSVVDEVHFQGVDLYCYTLP